MSAAVRYPARVMVRARVLREAGWTIYKIQGFLEHEFGRRPAHETVTAWVDEKAAERRRRTARRQAREKHERSPRRTVSPEWKAARMRELHAAGLTYATIGIVAGIWWGEPLVEHQVRYRLRTVEA